MSPQILFAPGITWTQTPPVTTRRMIDRAALLDRINDLESQWQEATDGKMHRVTLDLQALFDDIRELV